ncbi:MAG: flagellar protein FlaG [Desulfotomaculum sp.]|nr:flagellar protein FlaG [Desulfotomaculum sp.]
MKVGAGGLQSLLHHENLTIKQLEPARGRAALDQQSLQPENHAQKPVNQADLFKAVDRLNKAAQMFNYPFNFKIIKDKNGRKKVLVYNKKTGETQELEPEEAVKFAYQRETTTGKKFDDYA